MDSSVAAAGDEGAQYEVGIWLWPKNFCHVPHLCCWLLCCSEGHVIVIRVVKLVVHGMATSTLSPTFSGAGPAWRSDREPWQSARGPGVHLCGTLSFVGPYLLLSCGPDE